MKFDNTKKILVIGRAGLDIYPEPPGTKISDVNNFSSHLGGSAANTCVALSNLGVRTDLLTCISDDAIGEYIINKLNEFKVATLNSLSLLIMYSPIASSDIQVSKSVLTPKFDRATQVFAADPPKWEEKLFTSDIFVPGGSG